MTIFASGNRAKVFRLINYNKSNEKNNQIKSLGAFGGDGIGNAVAFNDVCAG